MLQCVTFYSEKICNLIVSNFIIFQKELYMLEWMQKHKKYLVITVWVSALALVFASIVEWGGGGFSTISSDSIAKVGDIYISRQEYQKKYNTIHDNVMEYMRQIGLPDDGKPMPEIEQEAFRILVQEKLLELIARDIGVNSTKNEIVNVLLNTPEFQDATHTFNKEQYENLLKANRWNTTDYEAFVAKTLLQEKMQNFPIMPVATLEANAFMSASKIKDFVELKLLHKDSVLKNAVIQTKDSEIHSYWERNKDKYYKPSHYKIAYIALDVGEINADREVLEKFYKDNETKYNKLSFEQSLEEVKSDYRKAILGFASSYMTAIGKNIAENNKDLQIKASNVITTMESQDVELLKKYFDKDIDIKNISLKDIPLYSLQLNDDGKDHSPLITAVSSGKGLLSPLEYSKEHWIIPYIIEKTPKQTLSFEQAKQFVSKDLMVDKQNDEFKKMVYARLSQTSKESIGDVVSLHLSLWQEQNTSSYKQLLSLGLNSAYIRQAIDYIMRHSRKDGVVFLGSDKALLFRIVKQEMPDYADLVNITNAEDEALQEAKIRDLRNAMFEYAIKHYKVIDYRRQN